MYKTKGRDELKLKPKELINQIENILKESGIDTKNHFQIQEAQLRILGLCYGEYIYTKRCKDKTPIYTAEQIIECTHHAVEYLKTKDWTQIQDTKHFINTVLLAVKNQLEWSYFDKKR
jgi:hypothetical protein